MRHVLVRGGHWRASAAPDWPPNDALHQRAGTAVHSRRPANTVHSRRAARRAGERQPLAGPRHLPLTQINRSSGDRPTREMPLQTNAKDAPPEGI